MLNHLYIVALDTPRSCAAKDGGTLCHRLHGLERVVVDTFFTCQLSELSARCNFEGVNSVVGIIPLPMRLGVLKRHLWLPDTGKLRHSGGRYWPGFLLNSLGITPAKIRFSDFRKEFPRKRRS